MTETTTEAATQEQAPTEVQPEAQLAEAVTTPVSEPATQTSETTTTSEPVDPTDNSTEVDAAAFWQKKGIDISTPEGLAKATKSYQEAERRMHETTQKQSELAKTLQEAPVDVDTDNDLLRQLVERDELRERKNAVDDFVRRNNITPEQDVALGKWLTDNPTKQQLVLNGYMSLDDAFKLSGIGDKDQGELKQQGGREALETLAHKQRTTAPRGSATTSTAPESDSIMDVLLADD